MLFFGKKRWLALTGVGSAALLAAVPALYRTPACGAERADGCVMAAERAPVIDYARGDGLREIRDFPPGGLIRIRGYGASGGPPGAGGAARSGTSALTGFDAIRRRMQARNGDVSIVLDGGDRLLLRKVDPARLTAANFQVQDRLEGGLSIHAADGWYVFNNNWGASDLVYGREYRMRVDYDPRAVADGTLFSWEFPPERPAWPKVYAYPSLMYGTDIYGNAPGASGRARGLPVRVADLERMAAGFAVTLDGDVGGFDVSYDLWLTRHRDGKRDDITNEVMVWLHQGDIPPYGTLVGRYEEGAYQANIYHTDRYTALIPSRDHLSGSIDMAAVLRRLRALGIVSGDEYLGQIDLGAEPIRGKGRLRIDRLGYDMAVREAGAGIARFRVDGRKTG